MKTKFILSFLLFCNILFVNNTFAQKRTEIGGTKISLFVPATMETATKFYGFQNESTMSSIMTMEVPAKFQDIENGFTNKTKLKAQGMTLVSNKAIKISGKKSILLKLKQSTEAVDLVRCIILCDNDSTVIMINGLCPAVETALAAEIEKALLSVEINKTDYPVSKPKTRLDVSGTVFTNIEQPLGPGSMMFSVDKERPSKNPFLILLETNILTEAAAQAENGEKQLKRRNRDKKLSDITTKPLTIKGFAAYETIAKATDEDGKTELLYLVMFYSDKETIYLEGSAKSDFDTNIALFRKVALTFK